MTNISYRPCLIIFKNILRSVGFGPYLVVLRKYPDTMLWGLYVVVGIKPRLIACKTNSLTLVLSTPICTDNSSYHLFRELVLAMFLRMNHLM